MTLRDLYIGQYVHLQDTGIGCVVAVDAEYGGAQPWKRQPAFVKVTVAMPPVTGANPLYSITGRFAADGDFEGTEFPDLRPCAHVRIAEEAPAHATDAPAAEDAAAQQDDPHVCRYCRKNAAQGPWPGGACTACRDRLGILTDGPSLPFRPETFLSDAPLPDARGPSA